MYPQYPSTRGTAEMVTAKLVCVCADRDVTVRKKIGMQKKKYQKNVLHNGCDKLVNKPTYK